MRLQELPEVVREAFEERAAILEHCAGMPRREAEQAALEQVAADMLGRVRGEHRDG